MTIEITDNNNSVTVTYNGENGGSASAVVIGESISSIEGRKQEIVDAHNLKAKATDSE